MFLESISKPDISTTKGTELMNSLLLLQYQKSTNLKEYFSAFIEEIDLLFYEIENVYLGRFIEWAEGEQLDVIGKILGETRGLGLPITFFGFSDDGLNTANAGPLADFNSPSGGGIFRSEGQNNTNNVELSDISFKRLLLAKAYLTNKRSIDINTCYNAISYLLGRVPQLLEISFPSDSVIQIDMSSSDTTTTDVAFIQYFKKYLVPLTSSLIVTRI